MTDLLELDFSTLEELPDKKILEMISYYEDEINVMDADQMSIKLAINSLYGTYLCPYFHFYSMAHAMTITGVGRNLWHYTSEKLNKYFLELWPKDYKLHERMGLTEVLPIKEEVVVYGDTDSIYFQLGDVYKNVKGWKYEDDNDLGLTQFVLELYKLRLEKFFIAIFNKYCLKYNIKNLFNFELETISRSAMFVTKKQYALDVAYVKGMLVKQGGKPIKVVGGDVVKSSTPRWVKNKLKPMIEYLLTTDKINITEIISKISTIKEEYFLQDIDVIAKGVRVNNYKNWVLNDGAEIVLKKATPFNVRAASYYNHLLRTKYPDLMKKYPLIEEGVQVKWYFIENAEGEFDRFAYLPNSFPYEFAPPIDKAKQFEFSFLKVFNSYMNAIGLNPININLFATIKLF